MRTPDFGFGCGPGITYQSAPQPGRDNTDTFEGLISEMLGQEAPRLGRAADLGWASEDHNRILGA